MIVSDLCKRHSVRRIVLWSTIISALSLVPLAAMAGGPLLPATLIGWGAVIGMALVSHAGGQSFLTYALAHLPASLSSMVQFLQVAVAAVAAWILLGETMTWIKLASAAAILVGIVVCRSAATKQASSMERGRAVAAMLFTMVVWGIGPLFLRFASVGFGPADALVIRFALVCVLYLAC